MGVVCNSGVEVLSEMESEEETEIWFVSDSEETFAISSQNRNLKKTLIRQIIFQRDKPNYDPNPGLWFQSETIYKSEPLYVCSSFWYQISNDKFIENCDKKVS